MATKSELRKARKAAVAAGLKLRRDTSGRVTVVDEPSDQSRTDPMNFSETPRGRRALDKWARRYDDLNGAPEGDWDR